MTAHKKPEKVINLFQISSVKDLQTKACIRNILEKATGQSEGYVPVYGYHSTLRHGRQAISNYAIGCFKERGEMVVVPIDTRGGSVAEIQIYSLKTITRLERSVPNEWQIYTAHSTSPFTLTVPPYVPDVGESHGQMPIDQADSATVFQVLMESFLQKNRSERLL